MSLSFEATWPLLLLAGLPVMWWVRRATLIEFEPRQLDLMVAIRALAFTLVVLALAQPVLHRTGSWLSTVYLLDVSRSVAPAAIEDAIDWVDRAEREGGSDHARFIAFGANTTAVDDSEALRTVPVADRAVAGALNRSASNIEGALERALASLPPYHVPRLVLLSDGHETAGDLGAAVDHIQREGVRLYTRPLQARFEADAWIDAVTLPDTVTAGSPFALTVEAYAQVQATGVLQARAGEEVVMQEAVSFGPGRLDAPLEVVIEDPGARVLTVELAVDGDPSVENNVVRLPVFVRPRPHVLYAEGRIDTARYLRDALEEGGFDVTLAVPWELPRSAAAFSAFEVVLLSDVDARMLSAETQLALRSYVEDLGGGLIIAGGESVYGEEGYSETPIEEAMPVWFKAERKPRDLALVIALDKSYSMVGDKMALAKEASKAALDLLEDDQRFGLLAFDYHFYWPVPLQLANAKARIAERISSIEASSPTNIYPALQDVYTALLPVEAEVKHVILLSDGKTYEDDYEGLATRMQEADITVSTVAVGDKADRELLGNIAVWGGGRSYFIEDPSGVPQIFIDETEMAQGITIEEDGPVTPVVNRTIEAFAGLEMEDAPPLLGFVRTMAKDNAEIVMETEEGDPILARWQYGLGRAVLFASDVKNRWAAEWLEWDGYGKFWAQLLRETMRQPEYRGPEFHVQRAGDRAVLRLDLVDPTGTFRNALRPEVEAIGPDGETATIEMAQTGPGRYEATFPVSDDGDFAFRWNSADGTEMTRGITPEVPEEYRYRPADEGLLQQLAAATGGHHDPTPAQLFDADGQSVVRPLQLWPVLVAAALLLYLANMALRRVRVFGEPLEATATEL